MRDKSDHVFALSGNEKTKETDFVATKNCKMIKFLVKKNEKKPF